MPTRPRPALALAVLAALAGTVWPSAAGGAEPVDDPGRVLGEPDGGAGPVPGGGAPGSGPEAAPDAPGDEAPGGPPAARTAPEVLEELRGLYRRIGAAEEAYRATAERLRAQQGRVARLSEGLAGTRTRLAETRRAVAQLAGAEYRGGGSGFSPVARLLLGGEDDPVAALHRQFVLERAAGSQAATLRALERDERRAGELAREARTALDTQQALARRQRQQEQTVRLRVAEVERLLASLPPEELAELAALERREAADAREELTAGGALPQDAAEEPAPSAAGWDAVTHALRELAEAADADGPPADGRTAGAAGRDGADAGYSPAATDRTVGAHGTEDAHGTDGAYGAGGGLDADGGHGEADGGHGEADGGRGEPEGGTAGGGSPAVRAWAAAGREIPATSGRQWELLERVPLDRLRPGDLVIYFPEAAATGLYVGAGEVVWRSHPGAAPRLAPLTVHPVLGAVRPDPEDPPLDAFPRPSPGQPAARSAGAGAASDSP